MRQKGFATIFALCLILILAFIVKGIEESEMNHAYETTEIQAEIELQNAADSGIYEAANKVRTGSVTVLLNTEGGISGSRKKYSRQFPTITKTSERFGTIKINVWSEHTKLKPYKVLYGSNNVAKNTENSREVYTFFSVAEGVGKGTRGKIYRRAFAYMLADGDATIHFMEVSSANISSWKD